jgi:hypothetical protein
MPHKIYPADFAKLIVEGSCAGKKYQPSNGTEGEIFISSWCGECARDKSAREGVDITECDDNEVCRIIGNTFAYRVDDPEYPIEWQYDKDGQPCCTAFVPAGQPIPPEKDEFTGDLFEAAAAQEGEGK